MLIYLWMSRTSGTNSSIRLKRDHQHSLSNESSSPNVSPSPPLKKSKTQPNNNNNNNSMDKDTRNRYPNSSSSAFLSSTQNSSMATKKLVIKNLKSQPSAPSSDHFEKIWPLLKQALEAILTGTTSPTNEEQLYRHIDHVCTTSTSETNISPANLLYENLRKVLTDHIQTLLPLLLG